MQRSKYDWSHENTIFGKVFEICPATRIEVVPGDSFEGTIHVDFRSDAVKAPVLPSSMLEYYLFYVPHRISDANWVDFIRDGSASLTTATASASRFFENGATTGKNKNILYRAAYREIYNEYFRDPEEAVSSTPVAPLNANRLRTFSSILRSSMDDSETLATAASDVTARRVREALARDRFNARRAMYGDKYTDFLKSLGVDVWAPIIEEPELIASSRARVGNRIVYDTSSTSTATMSSAFVGSIKCKVARKAFAEHGYLVGMVVWRPRTPRREATPIDAFKISREDFWSPEFSLEGAVAYPNTAQKNTDTASTVYAPKFEDYRVPDDNMFPPGSTPTTEWTLSIAPASVTADNFRSVSPASFDGYFRNQIGGNYHFGSQIWHQVSLLRPIARAPAGS